MLRLSNNCWLIEASTDLPELPLRIERLYLDLETSSGDPSKTSLNPWHVANCQMCLAAITWDDHENVYAMPRECVDFILQALCRSKHWVNQNVKYDAHVMFNDLGEDTDHLEYHDTLTLSKLVDSDRTYKGGYGLDVQAKHYCGIDLSYYYNSLSPWVGPHQSKDYGDIPHHVLGDYAANQVRANRVLHATLERLLPCECREVWATERRLTTTLVRAERRGIRIDRLGVAKARYKSAYRQMVLREELEQRIGYEFNPNSQPDCEDLFINRYGLPPIYTEKKGVRSKGPSFSKDVLKEYLLLDDAPFELIKMVQECRHESTMSSLFWDAWPEIAVGDLLHTDYNQCVRSGRMSASTPNSQQFNNEARSLVLPHSGFTFVCCDYSQVEFRLIVHYIGNQRIAQAYIDDPELDFHQFMADDCHIERKPAKIVNLAIGFGMGKKKTIRSLEREETIQAFTKGDRALARELAVAAHAGVHRRLPELKPVTRQAEEAARLRGYVKNNYHRRLHIPLQYARVGFNRAVQSHAADLIKERANALDDARRKYGAYIAALVHDETLGECPMECVEEFAAEMKHVLCEPRVQVSVPIRCSCGISDVSWLAAKKAGDEKPGAKHEDQRQRA